MTSDSYQQGLALRHRGVAHTLLSVLLCALACRAVSAQIRELTIKQFVHTAWGEKEGAPGGILTLAQTQDGYLWLGTDTGLYRFDGVSFEHYKPQSGASFPVGSVYSLLSLPNGDLWIGFDDGKISLLRNGTTVNYTTLEGVPRGRVLGLEQDREGTLWTATSGGLGRLVGSSWKKVGKDWKFPGKSAQAVFLDRQGNLWVATEDTLVVLPLNSKTFQPTGIPIQRVAQLAQSTNGKLWMAETSRSVRPVPVRGDHLSVHPTEIQVGSGRMLFDREGGLWITTLGDGIRRAPAPERIHGTIAQFSNAVESFTTRDGLTDETVHAIIQDREGNIWIGTNSGLDQFREGNIRPASLPINGSQATFAAGDDGDLWVNTLGSMIHFHGFQTSITKHVLITRSAYRSPRGSIWWVGAAAQRSVISLIRMDHRRMSGYPLPKKSFVPGYSSAALYLTEDHAGVLWVAIEGHGLFSLKEGIWKQFVTPPWLTELTPTAAYTDWMGRIWFGYRGGTVITLVGAAIQQVSSNEDSAVGSVLAINGRNQHVWLGGQLGLAFFDGHRLQPLLPRDAARFGRISGIEETSDGSLWLCESRGIVRIFSAEIRKSLDNPAYRVQYDLFSSLDGLPGSFRGIGQVAREVQGTDGRLWFMATDGLAWVNPARISKNVQPPPVLIRSVTADDKQFAPIVSVAMPARTSDVRIDYTALSLSIPQRVRFRYKLDGSDKEWQDAGARREAFYTNLSPGAYRFRVIACNNDGVWNEEGATLDFSIAPAWFQTTWFRVLCAAAALAIVWAFYQRRVQQIARAASTRFDERLAERTRIAGELHDAFLQTVQGSKLVADHALNKSDDPAQMHRALEQLSEWLARGIEEGRTALNSLRSSATQTNDLADAFRRATENCFVPGSMAVRFSVIGNSTDMHPVVRDEVYRIGYEAIRNACLHSSATELEIELRYARDLTLRISDNGIGIEPSITDKGKDGHFGLLGMRERAKRIDGKLTLLTSPSGTEIKLVVPGGIVFRTLSRA
jgi:signal transduction histidine kinase/ligand-binding sensor domain-containing protein